MNKFLVALVLLAAPATAGGQEHTSSLDELLGAEVGRPGGLTAGQVARRAVATSALVRARQAGARAASEMSQAATHALLPRIGLGARYTRLSRVEPGQGLPIAIPQVLDQWGTDLTVELPLSDWLLRLPQERSAAIASEGAAGASVAATQQGVEASARLVYWGWVRARLGGLVAVQAERQAALHLADTRAMHEVGAVSMADVLRAESNVAAAHLAVQRAHGAEARLADQLRTIARLPASSALSIGEDLLQAPAAGAPHSTEDLVREAATRRPELRALARAADAERARAAAARAAALPRLSAVAVGQLSNPNARAFPQEAGWDTSWQAGLGLSWGISGVGAALATGSALDAQADALEEERAALLDAIRHDVVDAAVSLDEADASLATTERGLRSAEESTRVRRELFRAGRATAAEVVDAETELTRARLDAVQARIDRRVAAVRLDLAVGR